MNNNGEYAATILYRYVSATMREAPIEEFEKELCDLKSAGYSVEGTTLNDGYLLAVLTKKLDSSVQKDGVEKQ